MEQIEEYKFKCEKCNFKTRYESHWKIHIETELHKTGNRKKRCDAIGETKCDKCDYKSINIINIKRHKLNEHGTKEERKNGFKYYCEYCDIGTFSNDMYEKHKKTQKHLNILNVLNSIKKQLLLTIVVIQIIYIYKLSRIIKFYATSRNPRQKNNKCNLIGSYDNNTIYVKLKLDKIKQITEKNKKSTSRTQKLIIDHNEKVLDIEDDEETDSE